jgi:hypothetical protein
MTDMDTIGGGDGDEVALPRFEHRLLLRLTAAHRAHTADNGSAGSHAPAEAVAATATAERVTARGPHRAGHRRERRAARRSLRVGLAGVMAAAGATLAITAVAQRPDGGGTGGDVSVGGPTGPAAPSDLATRIISASQEAEATTVVHVIQDNAGSRHGETWYDETTGAYRSVIHDSAGEPALDTSLAGDVQLQVDHCFSEYTDGPAGLPATPGSATRWVQNSLENGWLAEDGTEVVDGRELIRLVEREVPPLSDRELEAEIAELEDQVHTRTTEAAATTEPTDAPAPPSPTAEAEARAAREAVQAQVAQAAIEERARLRERGPAADGEGEIVGITLVDPETFRPVRTIGNLGSDREYVQTYEYLPRSPENLARLEADVPPGFTLVDRLRGDGEALDAGCA